MEGIRCGLLVSQQDQASPDCETRRGVRPKVVMVVAVTIVMDIILILVLLIVVAVVMVVVTFPAAAAADDIVNVGYFLP